MQSTPFCFKLHLLTAPHLLILWSSLNIRPQDGFSGICFMAPVLWFPVTQNEACCAVLQSVLSVAVQVLYSDISMLNASLLSRSYCSMLALYLYFIIYMIDKTLYTIGMHILIVCSHPYVEHHIKHFLYQVSMYANLALTGTSTVHFLCIGCQPFLLNHPKIT